MGDPYAVNARVQLGEHPSLVISGQRDCRNRATQTLQRYELNRRIPVEDRCEITRVLGASPSGVGRAD